MSKIPFVGLVKSKAGKFRVCKRCCSGDLFVVVDFTGVKI